MLEDFGDFFVEVLILSCQDFMLILKGVTLEDRFIQLVLNVSQLIFEQFYALGLVLVLADEDIK